MKQVVLLRGVNVGGRNRLPMLALREALAEAGMQDARTHLQSGNVVLDSEASPAQLAAACERVIAERFSLEVAVVVRTRAELAKVVRHDPLGDHRQRSEALPGQLLLGQARSPKRSRGLPRRRSTASVSSRMAARSTRGFRAGWGARA